MSPQNILDDSRAAEMLADDVTLTADDVARAVTQRGRSVRPLVTAVIPAYNSEETIGRAIESALEQTYRPLEILVVDDCSRDNTAKIVQTYADSGVKLLHLDKQHGASGARNAGVEAATGELIAFLDSDDSWMPLKLEKQMALILSDENMIFASCSSWQFSQTGEDLGDLYNGRRPVAGVECWKSLLARNTVATPSVLVWRKHMIDAGGFDESLRVCEDQDMWMRLASRGSVGYVDEWLVRVNSRANSLSSNLTIATLRIALVVVERHIAEQRSRLSSEEIRWIRAERLEWIGRAECNTDYLQGLPVLLGSLSMGYRPLQTIQFLISASPPSRWLKKRIFARSRMRRPRAETRTGLEWSMPKSAARVLHPMLPTHETQLVRFARTERPRLVVVVDAEEEFDWRNPLSRENRSVQTMAAQIRAHEIYRRFGVIPTYAVDYPVVAEESGSRPLLELLERGECEVGAQLHSWVTPPFEETVNEETSYAGNLPASLEHRKLENLVEAIERRFGTKPRLYRAGRYGAGKNTADILETLGFEVDCSVVPGVSRWSSHAPDYSGGTAHPYWLRTRRPILELPVTVATVGVARHLGEEFYRKVHSDAGKRLRLSGVMARSGLLNRIRLSPEGSTLREAKHLTRCLVERGYRVFSITYHSPSLEPGHTPYVRNARDLELFLCWIECYLEFFCGELNGVPDTVSGIYSWARTGIPATASLPVMKEALA